MTRPPANPHPRKTNTDAPPRRLNVLVTAGSTREPIDPVRFVSNRSTGRMGCAIARAAAALGHRVTLLLGPVPPPPRLPPAVRVVPFTTANDLLAAVTDRLPDADLFIMCAAPADWRPAAPAPSKLKKRDGPPAIRWIPTPDILQTVAPLKRPHQYFCGFAAETADLAQNALAKLRAKNLDAIAANDVSSPASGMASPYNEITLYFPSAPPLHLARAPKPLLARRLLAALLPRLPHLPAPPA